MLSALKKYLISVTEHSKKFWRWSYFQPFLKKYGMAFVIIMIISEIIEDGVLPGAMGFLGAHISPVFYLFIPLPWLFCLNTIFVPILFSLYCGYMKKEPPDEKEIREELH